MIDSQIRPNEVDAYHDTVQDVYEGLIETLLWSGTHDDKDEPLDDLGYEMEDIGRGTRLFLFDGVREFLQRAWEDVQIARAFEVSSSRIGHDLWLTMAGHGAGFWDGDYDFVSHAGLGDRLTRHVKAQFPSYSYETYVGDDDQVHIAGCEAYL